MAISREKHRAHRKKTLESAKSPVKLIEPTSVRLGETEKVREKIKVPAKARSALVPGEDRSMGMEID
jgi:large subunit ribosomal protein L24e